MSKSAIKTLEKAEAIMAKAGVVISLVEYLNDGKSRTFKGCKLWRNADKLAALIIDSAANAFQGENSTSFEAHGFKDMADAVEAHISSNLDDWSQNELEGMSGFFEANKLARLAEMVERNIAFEAERRATSARNNAFEELLTPFEQRVIVESAHDDAIAIDNQMHQDEFFRSSTMMQGVWVNLNHAEALSDDAARNK